MWPVVDRNVVTGRMTVFYVLPILYIYMFQYIYPTRCNFTRFIYIWKLLYMFRVLPSPIIRSAYNCICSNSHESDK
jgi:hypothetical protein